MGLDYLTLGQPLSTLSGGECQRIKLASELHKHGSIYVLDEPTTGLHMSDIRHLLEILNRLVEGGNTVIVIEHNTRVIKNADWMMPIWVLRAVQRAAKSRLKGRRGSCLLQRIR